MERTGQVLGAAAKLAIAGAFGTMVVAAIVQVASRYLFGSPLGWTEELVKLLMVWWTFLAVAVLAFRGRLLAIDALLLAVSARRAHLILAFAQLVSLIFIGWLAWLGVRLVGLAGSQITPALDIPYAYVYASLPVGLALATLGFGVRAAVHLRHACAAEAPHPVSALERSDT
ncbi:TRAP transporter small permease [Algihabitans albus]|uniref:TRAP transporter small permease n=1 Tax=Algihabitans albus TaxID=2164067 RepID=UPI000E5D0087|nr:TRAP transporter small permease [Algihabitans albus]